MRVFLRSNAVSGRLGMLLSGLWLRFFQVQGRCGQKDPRKLSVQINCLKRSWRILGVSRTACGICSIGLHKRENDVVYGLVPSARVWGAKTRSAEGSLERIEKKGSS